MSAQSLGDLLQTVGNPVTLARNSQIGPYVYPEVRERVHELAGRAARLAGDLLPLRPVLPHDRHDIQGPDALEAALGRRRQQLRELRPRQGEAARRLQQRRVRDRRRDPLLPRRRAAQPRRPALGAQLGAVPLRDGWLRRDLSSATSARPSTRTTARSTATSAGAERARGAGEGQRRAAARDQVLQHGLDHDRRPPGAGAAPRHVGRSGARDLRSLGRRRRGQGRARSRPATSSASSTSARASTRRTRSSRAGFRAHSRLSSPATT